MKNNTTSNTELMDNCEHEYETVCNLYGIMIKRFIRNGIVNRSLIICTKCGKRDMSTKVDKNCTVKNKPELWYE